MIESYIKSGKIVSEIRSEASKMIKEGCLVLDLVEYVEGEILKQDAGIAFPCNVSINEYAAHYRTLFYPCWILRSLEHCFMRILHKKCRVYIRDANYFLSVVIFFTFLGISILTNPLRPEKAPTPIVTTTSGITVFLHPKINVFVFLS